MAIKYGDFLIPAALLDEDTLLEVIDGLNKNKCQRCAGICAKGTCYDILGNSCCKCIINTDHKGLDKLNALYDFIQTETKHKKELKDREQLHGLKEDCQNCKIWGCIMRYPGTEPSMCSVQTHKNCAECWRSGMCNTQRLIKNTTA